MVDTNFIMRRAPEMQRKMMALQEQMGAAEFTGKSRDGRVAFTLTGRKEARGITIAADALTTEQIDRLQAAIMEAIRSAAEQADNRLSSETEQLMLEMGLPPDMQLPMGNSDSESATQTMQYTLMAREELFREMHRLLDEPASQRIVNRKIAAITQFSNALDPLLETDINDLVTGFLPPSLECKCTRAWRANFYDRDSYLIECARVADLVAETNNPPYAYALIHNDPSGGFVLGGLSAPLHLAAESQQLNLEDPAMVPDYVRMFCTFVCGEDGPFTIIDNVDGLSAHIIARFPEANLPGSWDEFVPIEVVDTGSDGSWIVKAWIQYGGGVFLSTFSVGLGGGIAMLDDTAIWEMPEAQGDGEANDDAEAAETNE
jgi:hypothetical protein